MVDWGWVALILAAILFVAAIALTKAICSHCGQRWGKKIHCSSFVCRRDFCSKCADREEVNTPTASIMVTAGIRPVICPHCGHNMIIRL